MPLSAAQAGLVALVEAASASSVEQRVARLLGIPRRTFLKRIERYGLPRPRKRP